METRTLDLRLLLAVALVAIVAAIWATTALAGGSSSSDSGTSNSPDAALVQDEGDGESRDDALPGAREDCPEGGSDSDAPDDSANL
jgi:hypothetical protein